MQKVSAKKISILGLVLMAASAVTAAIIPSKDKDNTTFRLNGSLVDSSGAAGGTLTCKLSADGNGACDYTATGGGAQSGTTGLGIAGTLTLPSNGQTGNNTTI